MREIESGSTKSDEQLARALRTVAGESAGGAPSEIGNVLAGKFRSHHARRRTTRRLLVTGLAACLVATVMLGGLLARKKSLSPTSAQSSPKDSPVQTVLPQPSTTAAEDHSGPNQISKPKPKFRAARPSLKNDGTRNLASHTVEFQALPAYNSTVRLEDTSVVRVELPSSALRLVGAPMSGDSGQSRVLADFLVGHDGTPYAVHLLGVRRTE
jgi:hypothetical protein